MRLAPRQKAVLHWLGIAALLLLVIIVTFLLGVVWRPMAYDF